MARKTRPSLSDITFGVTYTPSRSRDLHHCLRSIRRAGGSIIDSIDTQGNLSRARNILVARCRTPYFFLLEEDMRIRSDQSLGVLRDVLEASGCLGAGGALLERRATLAMAGVFRKQKRRMIRIDSATEVETTPEGNRFLRCDLIFNFGLFCADRLKAYHWDERLEMAEHFEFFWRLPRGSVACTQYAVTHLRSRPKSYRDYRRRLHSFRQIEYEIAGRFVKTAPWDAHLTLGGTSRRDIVASIQRRNRRRSAIIARRPK